MAVVPFRVSGAAADQSLEQRLFQIGPYTLFIKQNPKVLTRDLTSYESVMFHIFGKPEVVEWLPLRGCVLSTTFSQLVLSMGYR